jgi:hypothetical protein
VKEPVVRTPAEAELLKRRRWRNIALGLVLGGLVIIFYVLTIAKMGPAVLERPL